MIDCFLITQPTPAPTTDPTSNPTNAPTAEPTLPGQCSDGTGSCSATDLTQCSCAGAARRRNLLKGDESNHNLKQNLRRLPKKTPSPVEPPSLPPTNPPVAPTNPVRSQFASDKVVLLLCKRYSQHNLILWTAHCKPNQ